jgi:hypothetical protein
MARHSAAARKVGDRVSFLHGTSEVSGRIVEDRGLIGVGGRRLLRVSVQLDPVLEPVEFEIPEVSVSSPPSRRGPGKQAPPKG